jgi:subtilisin-like proprotein convertase family protein
MVNNHKPLPVKSPGFKPGAGTLFNSEFKDPISIPDNLAAGVTNTITIPDSKFIADLNIYLNIEHSWVGDLVVNLTHRSPGADVTTITLLNRPGFPAIKDGCSGSDIVAILDDDSPLAAHDWCGGISPGLPMPAISGMFSAYTPLTTFIGEEIAGEWSLNVSDQNQANAGKLVSWRLDVDLTDESYSPPLPPPPPNLPASAQVSGVTGVGQSMPLDCESRSALDFAAFFGFPINEYYFFVGLPTTDNPDTGFVGDVYGQWGQIPPNPYGVHAKPIAERLIQYGVEAHYYRRLSWDAVRSEIAQNRPVIVWVPGPVRTSKPVYYTPSDGKTTLVAPYEHTVMVVGYSPDRVWIQDGSSRYDRSLSEFFNAWSTMRFMAVMAR